MLTQAGSADLIRSPKPVISDPLTGQDSNHWDTITTATYGCSFRGESIMSMRQFHT
jgi:hypothetical protein